MVQNGPKNTCPAEAVVAEPTTRADAEPKDWTVMAYICGDNNLETWALKAVNEMERAGSTDDVNLIAQIDRIPGHDSTDGDWTGARRYFVQKDVIPGKINSKLEMDLGEVNMGDYDELREFIDWGVVNYPAERYMLIFMDHGNGYEGVIYDDTNGDHIDISEMEDLSAHNRDNQFNRTDFEAVVFDACLMQQAAVVYAFSDFTDYVVGSQQVVYAPGFPYYKVLKELNTDPEMKTTKLCEIMIDEYDTLHMPYTYSYDYSAIDVEAFVHDLIPVINALSERLIFGVRHYQYLLYRPIMNARLRSWDTLQRFMDLYDFCEELENERYLPGTVGDTIIEYAQLVRSYLNDTIIAQVTDDDDPPPTGLSIFFPVQDFMITQNYVNSWFASDYRWMDFLNEYFSPGQVQVDPPQGPRIVIEEPGDYDFVNGTIDITGKISPDDRTPIHPDGDPYIRSHIDRGEWTTFDLVTAIPDDEGWHPFLFTLDTTVFPNGLHRLTLQGAQSVNNMYDITGDAWDHIYVNLDNGIGNHPPYVEITDPVADQIIENKTHYTFKGKASDSDQGVKWVEILLDEVSNNWVQATGNESWSYYMDISQHVGWYTFKARAYDGMTYSYTSVDVLIINSAMNGPPTAVISWPKADAEFDADEAIFFDGGNSTDPDNDRLTYYWHDNVSGMLAEDLETFYKTLSPGAHKIRLDVKDEYYTDSAYVNINVTAAETVKFLVIDYEQGGYRELDAYLTQTRDNCHVYVEEGYSVDSVNWANTFNNTIYPQVRAKLGYEPDIDLEGHVWILACHLGGGIAGYYQDNDPNEKDMIYIDTTYGDTDVVAHEFGHMTHHNYDPSEERWIDEGIAQYTPWFTGLGPIDQTTHISHFFANPDVTLTWTQYSNEWPVLLSQYGVGIAFVEYMSERYNGTEDVGELLRDGFSFTPKPSTTYQGVDGVDHMLQINDYNETFEDVYRDFTVANFIDDPTYYDGRYGYPDIKANGAATRVINEFPANGTDTLNPYAADYYEVTGSEGTLSYGFECETGDDFYLMGFGFNIVGNEKRIAYNDGWGKGSGVWSTVEGFGGNYTHFGIIIASVADVLFDYKYEINVTVITNDLPIAEAGVNQTVHVLDIVQFDGSASYDPDGSIVEYKWDFDGANGVDWDLPDSDEVSPIHRYDNAGIYTATLWVKDDKGTFTTDTVVITVKAPNKAPVAEAGEDQEVRVLDLVQFNSTGSYDPDEEDFITYFWDFGDGNTSEEMFPEHSYELPETYYVTLTVNDTYGAKTSDNCEVTVAPNRPPTVEAGGDQKVKIGETVYFDGNDSLDPEKDPLTFYWDFDDTNGIQQEATGAGVTKVFAITGEYVVTLTVIDSKFGTATDTLTVTVNAPPVAEAGEDVMVYVNDEVTFDGRGSTDPQGENLMFMWDLDEDGKKDKSDDTFTHKFREDGVYNITLTVKNTAGFEDSDVVVVTVLPAKVLNIPVIISPESYSEAKGYITVIGSLEDWQDVDALYYNVEWQGWNEIQFSSGTWSFQIDTTQYSDVEIMVTVKAVMGEEETDPNDCFVILVVNNILDPIPDDDDGDDDVILDDDLLDDDDDDEEDEKIFGMKQKTFFIVIALIIGNLLVLVFVIFFFFRAPKKKHAQGASDVDWDEEEEFLEPDELEDELELVPVELAEEEVEDEEKSPEEEGPGDDDKVKFKIKKKKVLKEEALPDIEDPPDFDEDDLEVWDIKDEPSTPEMKVTKIRKEIRPVVCPSCKQTFDVVDDGKRPLKLSCTHCGVEGMVKGEQPSGKEVNIKCPSCDTKFGAVSGQGKAECPSCGVSGMVP